MLMDTIVIAQLLLHQMTLRNAYDERMNLALRRRPRRGSFTGAKHSFNVFISLPVLQTDTHSFR
jgi:hypothetical protein